MTTKQKHAEIGAYVDARESMWDVSDEELYESAMMAEHDPLAPPPPLNYSTLDFLRKHMLAPL